MGVLSQMLTKQPLRSACSRQAAKSTHTHTQSTVRLACCIFLDTCITNATGMQVIETQRHTSIVQCANDLCEHLYCQICLCSCRAHKLSCLQQHVMSACSIMPTVMLKMQVVKESQSFQRVVVTRDEALAMFQENKFKVEIISGLPQTATISLYRSG